MADVPAQLPKPEEFSFEACLSELQDVVRALEEGTLDLDRSIACFERAVSLLRRCYQALEQAEQKIQMLIGFDRAGNALTAPFDAEATAESASSPGKRKPAAKKAEPDPGSATSTPIEDPPTRALF